jgi:hypothetical protein
MNRRRDIERVLDVWLVDGSSRMPDRLFEAVLDRVDRTPQRRRPWTTPKSPALTPRLAAATAFTLVVVSAAGFALLGGPTDPGLADVTPSPVPSTSEGADEAVPEALRHSFHGAVIPVPTPPYGSERSVIRFGATSFDHNVVELQSTVSAPAPDRIRLVAIREAGGCAVGDEGTYTWSSTPGATKVTFRLVEDACDTRAAVLPGAWLRSDCRWDAFCLADPPAGGYASLYFDPALRYGDPWRPRPNALTYVIPDGWAILADWDGGYDLAPQGAPDGSGIFVRSDPWAVFDTELCRYVPDSGAGLKPTEIVDWLTRADELVASDPAQSSIGGLSGWLLDVAMDPEWTSPCPPIGGVPYRPLGLGPDTRMRLYVLVIGDGRALLVSIEAPDQDAYAALLDEATAIVESFEFEPPPGG